MNRTLLQFLLPFIAAIATAIPIAAVGLILLAIGAETRWDILGLFDISAAVVVAILIAAAVLAGATLLASIGKSGQQEKP